MHHTAGIHVFPGYSESGNRPVFIDLEVERARGFVLEWLLRPCRPACKFTALYNRCCHRPHLVSDCVNHTLTAPFDKRAVGA